MKSITQILLPLAFLAAPLSGDNGQRLEVAIDEMNDYYRTGCGCEDGVFNAMSGSMVRWGVGLVAGIALVTGLIHNTHQDSTVSNDPRN